MVKEKKFTHKDQINFQNLSGDCNPIHVDKNAALKTHAGQQIVHGIHIFLWALDSVNVKLYSNLKIDIKFMSQVNLDTKLTAVINKSKNRITVTSNKGLFCHCIINIEKIVDLEKNVISNENVFFNIKKSRPDNNKINYIKEGQKSYKLYGGRNKSIGKQMFPNITKNYGLEFVYEVACTSSITGMKVPGLHSLFLRLTLLLSYKNKKNYIKINKINDKLKFVSINYYGINFDAKLETIFRPEPIKTRPFSFLKKKYGRSNYLKNTKVLVIGGSRGIGAYVAKLCSIKGADVTITYKTQFTLALNIKKEILANGGKIKLIKLDVLDKNVLKKINQKYDQIYYFATPKIISNLKKQISPDLLKEYNLFYVQVFKKIVEKYKRLNKNIKFFYPSTIYIEEKNKKFREYWIAKKRR